MKAIRFLWTLTLCLNLMEAPANAAISSYDLEKIVNSPKVETYLDNHRDCWVVDKASNKKLGKVSQAICETQNPTSYYVDSNGDCWKYDVETGVRYRKADLNFCRKLNGSIYYFDNNNDCWEADAKSGYRYGKVNSGACIKQYME